MEIKKITRKLIGALEIVAVLLFIVFEKSIWTFAVKVLNFIKTLKVFAVINEKLGGLDKLVIMLIFMGLFIMSKTLSLTAVYLIGTGSVFLGIFAYMCTFPVGAAMLFLLETQKETLKEYKWFFWSYTKVELLLKKLKESGPYVRVQAMTLEYRIWLDNKKATALHIKNNKQMYTTKLIKRYKAVSKLVRTKWNVWLLSKRID